MICPYCYKEIKDTNNYCPKCGKKLSKEIKLTAPKTPIINDDDLIKAYIGKNYQTIKNDKTSIPAFLFGPFYLLYRKLWLSALLLIFINILLILYTSQEIFILISLIIEIYLGTQINSILINRAKQDVEEIKLSNTDKSFNELLAICKTKGGTSLTLLITIVLISSLILTNYLLSSTKTEKVPIAQSTIKTIETMTYTVPNNTKLSKYSTALYHHYSFKNDTDFCSFSILTNEQTSTYNTADNYIDTNITYNKDINNIEKNKIIKNNTTWSSLSIINNNSKETYYVTKKNNKFYIIESRNYNNTFNCNKLEESLFESINF